MGTTTLKRAEEKENKIAGISCNPDLKRRSSLNMHDPSAGDIERARELARRYDCEFVDLRDFKLNRDFLKRVPPELMFRYNFLPVEDMRDGRIAVALADPSQLLLVDEISLLLGRRLMVRVAALSRINKILRGFDPNLNETAHEQSDEPPSPGMGSSVWAPKKPRPHLRSGGAEAIPEEDQ